VLKILQHGKIWATIPTSKFWGGGGLVPPSPVIYAHACWGSLQRSPRPPSWI